MKTKSIAFAAIAALSLASVLALAACSDEGSDAGKTGSVAATLGDITIYEDDVTAQVESLRAYYGYDDDTYWAWVLTLSGYTAESFREYTIESMVYGDVLPVAAEKLGITVDPADVDAAIAAVQESYGLTDEQWATTLSNSGYTAESYRSAVEASLLETAVYEAVTADATITDEIFEEYGMPYVSSYYANMKRSSHILFAAEDEETAKQVLDEITAGTLDFAEAVSTYSIDTGSAVDGGDVGWDGLATFVTEYQDALDELSVGEMSGLVLSQFGYHIILCTDEFTWTEDTTVADVPSELYDIICTYYLSSSLESVVYNAYIEEVRNGMGFEVYPMPAGLSYDVDIEALLNPETDEGDGDEGAGDESAGDEGSEARPNW